MGGGWDMGTGEGHGYWGGTRVQGRDIETRKGSVNVRERGKGEKGTLRGIEIWMRQRGQGQEGRGRAKGERILRGEGWKNRTRGRGNWEG